jgi:hypothetical protein
LPAIGGQFHHVSLLVILKSGTSFHPEVNIEKYEKGRRESNKSNLKEQKRTKKSVWSFSFKVTSLIFELLKLPRPNVDEEGRDLPVRFDKVLSFSNFALVVLCLGIGPSRVRLSP